MTTAGRKMKKSRMNLNHFASRANEAAFWEAWVGAVLARCGLYTLHHPFTVANHLGEIHEYTHSWDLDVSSRHPSEAEWHPPHETEVKSLALSFTSPLDYPYEQVMVCSEANQRRKYGQCVNTERHFLLVSRDTGAMVYVPPGTVLRVKVTTDSDRGETYKVVYCDRKDLRDLKAYVQAVGG